jgi:hypothetical protein
MIPDDHSNAVTEPSANLLPSPSESVARRLLLMRQLHASLCAGHRAMLALDLAGIERSTLEQAELARTLAEDISRCRTSAEKAGHRERFPAEKRAAGFMAGCPELEAELRLAERDVLQALRLQAALLSRSQHKLRVLGNMLADPGINYGPLLGKQRDC